MRSLGATYKGVLYRSRLECRWKIFFDAVGVGAAYEPEVLNLGAFTYIPDFYLAPFGAWVEIKGEIVNDREGLRIVEKCAALALQSERPVILNFHDPLDPICAVFRGDRMYAQSRWTHCVLCGQLALKVSSASFTYTWCPREHEGAPLTLSQLRTARRLLYQAALTARQHRFGVPRARRQVSAPERLG